MAPPIQDLTHAHLNEQTKSNMSAIADNFTGALKLLTVDRNKYVNKTLPQLMTEEVNIYD